MKIYKANCFLNFHINQFSIKRYRSFLCDLHKMTVFTNTPIHLDSREPGDFQYSERTIASTETNNTSAENS